MNEVPSDLKAFGWWLLTGAMAFITWLGHRQLKRLDTLESNYVSKADFEARLGKLEAAQLRQHKENTERLEGIRTEVTGTNQRLDVFMQNQIRPWR